MTPENLRIAAGVVGLLLLASMFAPYLPGILDRLVGRARADLSGVAPVARSPSAPSDFTADLHVVLDIATRLQAAGRDSAVTVARQLLDEMLRPAGGETVDVTPLEKPPFSVSPVGGTP
jgi:hypothetical protein